MYYKKVMKSIIWGCVEWLVIQKCQHMIFPKPVRSERSGCYLSLVCLSHER